ncbi:hypothetical protein QR680_017590 [Steinernema hermaphroditum]|uniref:Uncharacterized protein n=1 Tax=Steinernema hermaphroditum TaxID=289476 RepID=A0AA39HF46_9BILA|nr:hypothetical protein QR680_017590 [Steinernema hermaphroditum]
MFFLLVVAVFGVFLFWRHRREQLKVQDYRSKAVLITGCDSGFGRMFALKCLAEGMPVFTAFLTEAGRIDLVDSAKLLPGRLHAFQMDVTSAESVKKGKNFVEEQSQPYKGLFGIVNNAGVASNTALDDWLTLEDYQRVVEVNTFGAIRVTQTFKDLVKRTRGRIVTTASICGRIGLPGMGPYAVSKHAIEGYCDVIRNELANFGVKVSIVEPGFFRTPMTDSRRVTAQIGRVWEKTTPKIREEYGDKFFRSFQERAEVVDAYFHALTALHPRGRYHVGWDALLLFIPLSFLPAEVQTFLITSVQKLQKFPTPAAIEGEQI